ncbi:MAG TPA: hypothetical protein VLA87_07405 [Gaiellaceae bacterium]|nr:hypothetical protein [Gaiellaceae bacterium]
MLQPETHLDVVDQRHSDLLREARTGELAVRLATARRRERRSLLARLRQAPERPESPNPAASR